MRRVTPRWRTGAFCGVAAAALLLVPVAPFVRTVGAHPVDQRAAPIAGSLDAAAAETQLVDLLNDLRAQRGLAPLQNDPVLATLARERSRDMLERGYFSHDIPGVGLSTDWVLDEVPNALAAAENLGRSNEPNDVVVADLFTAWVLSPGHLANIVSPGYNRVGIGIAEAPFEGDTTLKVMTELFATSGEPLVPAGPTIRIGENG